MKGVANELTGVELARGLEVFDRVSQADIGRSLVINDASDRRSSGSTARPSRSIGF